MTNNKKHTFKAFCLCKRFSIDIPVSQSSLPLTAQFCHCNRCRRSSGALCATYLNLTSEGFSPDNTVLSRLTGYKSSEKITRWACSTCGCHVLWHGPEEREWWIPTGCLDRLDGLVNFSAHIYIEDTVDGGFSDWITHDHGSTLRRSATGSSSAHLQPGWRGTEVPSIAELTVSNSPARLHAHCDCGGVNMYIARPSAASENMPAPWPPNPDVLVPDDSGPSNRHENETWWLRADKQKFLGGVCSCDSCRLATGFEFIEWAFVPTCDLSLDPEGKVPFCREIGTMRKYRSSDSATRWFCGKCFATVFWDGDIRPGLIDVAVGLLDAPEGSRAESWLEWRTERVSYREDAESRALYLVEAVEKGLSTWGKEIQGRHGPQEDFLQAHKGDVQ